MSGADLIEAVRSAMAEANQSISRHHDGWNPPMDREARILVAGMRAYHDAILNEKLET